MDVGATNGWRLDDVVPAPEIVDAHRRRAGRSSRSTRTTAARSPRRWRYRDGGGEIGVIASVTPAVLRRLHARPALGRGQALHLPVREPAATTCARCCAAGVTDDELDERIRGLWRGATDRYSELRTAEHAPRRPKVEMSHIGG